MKEQEKKKDLYVTIGISGSGKSTWANKIGYDICVSTDDIRKELTGNINDQSKNKEVFKLAYERIYKYSKDSRYKDVIYDATNCNLEYLTYFCFLFEDFYNIVFVVFDTSVDTCIKRIIDRENGASVPYKKIIKQRKQFEKVLDSELYKQYKKIIF